MRSYLRWMREHDPLGATLKGGIVVVFGAIFIAAGGVLVGVVCVVAGLVLAVLPVVLVRRDQARLQRWQRRRP